MTTTPPEPPILAGGCPDLGALDLLLSVVRHGSLAAAARAHRISQPSASSRIQHLERKVGFRLLDRDTTGSSPTGAGAQVALWAQELLGSARRFEENVSALRSGSAHSLKILASYTVAEYVLPGWLHQLRQQDQRYAATVSVMNSQLVMQAVRSGIAELGFVEGPDVADDLDHMVVMRDELVVVVDPRHPWSTRSSIPADELSRTRLALREEGSGTRAALETALVSLGLPAPVPAVEFGSTAAVIAAVTLGSAPTVVSRLAVGTELAAGTLVQVPLQGVQLARELRAVWRSGVRLSEPALRLLDHATRQVGRSDQAAASTSSMRSSE